ncbi:MAG: hypothetical protein LDL31_13360 [Prosthecobacter sp.]|jgi:hypothetical protein|nr:hypothetical protein [Prosthecobacter sp.]
MSSQHPDLSEKLIRFACGMIFGLAFGTILGAGILRAFSPPFWVATVCICLLCGWLAMRQGDAFWDNLPDWLTKLWWWRH